MLLSMLALGLALQIPQSPSEIKTWVDRGFDPGRPAAHAVAGSIELTRSQAWDSAQRSALDEQRALLTDLGARRAESLDSGWLPSFLRQRVVEQWVAARALRVEPKVVDREIVVRDHEFGRSFQAYLLVDEASSVEAIEADERGLRGMLARSERRFLAKCGGAVGLWGLVALMISWFDRLTRGYMTGRLYSAGALLATGVPILLVLL